MAERLLVWEWGAKGETGTPDYTFTGEQVCCPGPSGLMEIRQSKVGEPFQAVYFNASAPSVKMVQIKPWGECDGC